MRVRAMERRFSWDRSAAEYAKLYERALELLPDRRPAIR
jgi:glycogen synthase